MNPLLSGLLEGEPVIVNIGVHDFALSMQAQGAEVIDVDWSPPAGGDQEMIKLLDELL